MVEWSNDWTVEWYYDWMIYGLVIVWLCSLDTSVKNQLYSTCLNMIAPLKRQYTHATYIWQRTKFKKCLM